MIQKVVDGCFSVVSIFYTLEKLFLCVKQVLPSYKGGIVRWPSKLCQL